MINEKIATEKFNLACKLYVEAKEVIRELTSYVKTAYPDFSFEIAMKQFDLILQGVLLRTAAEDGYFLEEERLFIEKITDYGNIISYFNKKGVSVSWDIFTSFSNEDLKDFSLKLLVALKDLADNFVTPFAMVDSKLPKDYCEILTEKMVFICLSLAQCDGDSIESPDFRSEGVVATTLINKIIKEKWNEIKSQNVQTNEQNKSETTSRSNSLKANFLKKKTLT